ncbi:hypothetical protein PRZ61_10760 [Halomonas pacifica]|uniref:hypothetical protein n=1 Tax=Bisbaumannia pacifica TaxID=77098 RepID=UPI002358520B|nr:hypothetical protein [Halomonas pacifica]MDC8803916.1 hypothetical protein [Halomonas pacifica]
MSNVTRLHPVVRHEFDLPMEVLGVLMRQAEPTAGEIAHDIETHHGRKFRIAEVVDAIRRLLQLGWRIEAHNDPDGVRYVLVQGGSAA